MPSPIFYLELDKTGLESANLVSNEPHTLTGNTAPRLIIPAYGAFYSESLKVYSIGTDTQERKELTQGTQYLATEMLHKVTKTIGKSVCTVVLILPTAPGNEFEIRYQALGGHDQINRDLLIGQIEALSIDQVNVNWEDITNKPKEFPPAPHIQDALDVYGLEYVVDALEHIKYAVNTGDEAIHQTLITQWKKEQIGFFYDFNTEVYNRVDTVTTLNKSAEESLKILSVNLKEITERIEGLPASVVDLQNKILDYRHLNGNDRLANVANLLCKRHYDKTGELIDVPPLFHDLYLYLDSQNYDAVNHRWMDKLDSNKGFVASSSHVPSYGPSYTRPGIKSLKFTKGKWMYKSQDFSMNLIKGRTVIVVLGHRDNNKRIEMPVFSGASKKLSVDTNNEVAAMYSDLNGSNPVYIGKTSKYLSDDPFVDVINLGAREKDCLCLNNTPYNHKKAPNNIIADSLNVDAVGEDLGYIGSPNLNQDSEVFMVLIYQRELSKVEIHSVLTYLHLKYGTAVNYLTNPSFEEGDTNFNSELQNYLDFSKRDCIKVTAEQIASLDTQNNYSDSGFADPLDIRLDSGKYLFVLSQNPSLSFWSQEVLLDPNTRYVFKYSLMYGLTSPPVIRLKINGNWHHKELTLRGTRSIVRDVTYSFVTGSSLVNKLELFNLNASAVGNGFGIDQMSLVRIIYSENT